MSKWKLKNKHEKEKEEAPAPSLPEKEEIPSIRSILDGIVRNQVILQENQQAIMDQNLAILQKLER